MDEILVDFKSESKGLVNELVDLLDDVEDAFEKKGKLEEFGQIVDRIMGGAQSLAMMLESTSAEYAFLSQIGQYSEVCKLVGYKGSQIENNEAFYNTVVAFLQDAVEHLQSLIEDLGETGAENLKDHLDNLFLDRLRWISQQFDSSLRGSVDTGNSQAEIDKLLKQLGVG